MHRVVLITIALVATTAALQLEDIYSKPEILIVDPDRIAKNFWSQRIKNLPKCNDSPRGYREIIGIPWALFKPSSLETFELTKPLPPQASHAHPNIDHDMMNQHFSGYARRSGNEMSTFEKEYQAVRKALALDRVQPLRRSMELPATRYTEPQIESKQNEKTVKDLLPLVVTLANEIDDLDSGIGAEEGKAEYQSEDGRRRRGLAVLRVLAEEFLSGSNRNIDYTENITKKKSSDGINPPDSRRTPIVSESKIKPVSPVQKVKNDRNHTREVENGEQSTSSMAIVKKQNSDEVGAKPSSRVKLDQSATPASRSLVESPATKSSSESSENFSGLIPEHRAFRTVALVKKPVNEEADTSVELVN